MHLHETSSQSRPRDDPPGHRYRNAGGGGIAQRQALEATRGEEAKRLRLDRVRCPAQRLGGLDGRWLQPLAQHPEHSEVRSEEHTSELQSHLNLVCRLLLEKKKIRHKSRYVEVKRAFGTQTHATSHRSNTNLEKAPRHSLR